MPGLEAVLHTSQIKYSNTNEGEERIFLIYIWFGSCEVQRLNLALEVFKIGQRWARQNNTGVE